MLSGKLAVVTGGGSGIGRAVCAAFSKQGSKVAIVDINGDTATQTLESLEGPQQHAAFTVDVSSGAAITGLMRNIKQTFSGVPSIAVNCAGIAGQQFLFEIDEERFSEILAVNLRGTFLLSKAVSQHMVENKIQGGSIINISSIVGKTGNAGLCHYAASKAGVIGFSKSAAKDLAQFGIRCNAVLPGFIDTPMVGHLPEEAKNGLVRLIPLARMGRPEEIADVCVFLASDKSSYITGTTIEVTGGLHM